MSKREGTPQPELLNACGPVRLNTPLAQYMQGPGALNPTVPDRRIGYTALTDTTGTVQAVRVQFHHRGRGFHYTVPVTELVANNLVPANQWTPVREGDYLIDLRASRSLLDLWRTEVAPRAVEAHALKANTAFRDSRISHAAQLPSPAEAVAYLADQINTSLTGQWDNALALALVLDPQHPAHTQLVPPSLQEGIRALRTDVVGVREFLAGLPLQEDRSFRLPFLADELYHLVVTNAQIQATRAGFIKHPFGETADKLSSALMKRIGRRQKLEDAIIADLAYLSPGRTQEEYITYLNNQAYQLAGVAGFIA